MNVVRFALDSKEWGRVLLLRPIPRGDNIWGDLAPLQGTPWGDLLPTVTGEALSHALHGHIMPLMRQLGTPPRGLNQKVPSGYRWCDMRDNGCLIASSHCQPGPKLPACFVPPEVPPEAKMAVTVVALAWAEGRYVILVEGPEFAV